jgi:hypothetical protein
MPRFVVEREIPGAGNLTPEELRKSVIDPTTAEG